MMADFTETELTEAFEYLDDLRASGRTNMWTAHGFLARDLLWPNKDANEVTGLWMKTFSSDRGVLERVAQAIRIEARRGETVKLGMVRNDESAVAESDAHNKDRS